jgi:hypothetical protein
MAAQLAHKHMLNLAMHCWAVQQPGGVALYNCTHIAAAGGHNHAHLSLRILENPDIADMLWLTAAAFAA